MYEPVAACVTEGSRPRFSAGPVGVLEGGGSRRAETVVFRICYDLLKSRIGMPEIPTLSNTIPSRSENSFEEIQARRPS